MTASPKGNCYWKGRGFKYLIPFFYRKNLAEIIIQTLKSKNDFTALEYTKGATRFNEYSKKIEYSQSTIHLKGFWLTNPGETLPSDF